MPEGRSVTPCGVRGIATVEAVAGCGNKGVDNGNGSGGGDTGRCMMLVDDDEWVMSDVGRPGVDGRLGGGVP